MSAAVLGAGGFDWSSALIAVAVLAGLLIVSVAVIGVIREGKDQRTRRRP